MALSSTSLEGLTDLRFVQFRLHLLPLLPGMHPVAVDMCGTKTVDGMELCSPSGRVRYLYRWRSQIIMFIVRVRRGKPVNSTIVIRDWDDGHPQGVRPGWSWEALAKLIKRRDDMYHE